MNAANLGPKIVDAKRRSPYALALIIYRMRAIAFSLIFLLANAQVALASLKTQDLAQDVQKVAASTRGSIGLTVHDLASGQAWSYQGDVPFKMQSVAKIAIAVCVLKLVDEKKLELEGDVPLTREDVKVIRSGAIPDSTRSSARSCKLLELLRKAICNSNNGAADVLTRLSGGPQAVNSMLADAGIAGMRIDRYQHEIVLKPGTDNDAMDRATPNAACDLLIKLNDGRLLSNQSTATLLRLMQEVVTGEHRLRGGFPANYVVAHKTGTGRTTKGVCVATNDVGIVTRPNGEKLVIAVFLADAPGNDAKRDETIARLARAVCEASAP